MREPENAAPAAVSSFCLVVALALAAVVLGVVLLRLRPPAPLPVDAPRAAFSAARAAAVLRDLAGNGAPHPVGSAAHAAVQARLVARLQALGVPVAVRTSFVCSGAAPVCGTVENVIARLPGGAGARAVLLVAHYDSVGAGGGIADDLASVAALVEVARALGTDPPAANPVVLLIDDGEEAGLLGAEAFVADDPLARDVGAVVNLEARGTGGESIMFETSDENAWLVDAYGRSVRRPAALSLTYEAYKRLPNFTDLTVFKRAGMAGMNFAFIDELSHYHTPLDDLAHLDLGSLQHQGENALAVARTLADADLAHPRPGRSCYQDLLGFALLRWPAGLTLPLAAGAGALLLFTVWVAIRRRRTTAAAVLWGLGGFAGIALAAAGAGLVLTRLIETIAGTADPWLAHPLPARLSLWAGALAAGGVVASLAARRAGFRGLLAGTWLGWSGLAVGVAALAPGASTMFLIPTLTAAVFLAAAELFPPAAPGAALAAASAALVPIAAVTWMPLGFLLESTFGLARGLAVTVPLAMVITTVAPLLALGPRWRRARARVLGALACVAVLAAVTAAFVPKYSAQRPQPLNIAYAEDHDTGVCSWVAGGQGDGLPAGLRAAARFAAAAVLPFPWSEQRQFVAPAPAAGLPAPELTVVRTEPAAGGRSVTARLCSERGAPNLAIFVPSGAPLTAMTAGGKPVALGHPGPRRGRYRRFAFVAVPAAGVDVTLVFTGEQPVEVLVVDQSSGLPTAGKAILAARPDSAVPIGAGDVTLVLRRARL